MKLIELILKYITKWYVWVTLLVIFLVFIGWTTVSEVKDIGQQILDKIESIEIDI